MMNPSKSIFASQPQNAWSTLPTFNSRRAESFLELHRGIQDAARYVRRLEYRNIRDELRAAYTITPAEERLQQWLQRQQQRREEFREAQFRETWALNGEAEAWEVEERQKWLLEHQQPHEEAHHQPEDPQLAVPVPQVAQPAAPMPQPEPQQRPPTPQQPSDPEPEQQPSTSAASDPANRKRRQGEAPSAAPAKRARLAPVPEAVVNAPEVDVPVEPEAAEVVVVPAKPVQRRRRRQPIANPQNKDIEGRNLPDAPPVVVKLKVIVGQKLLAKDQKQVIRRKDFKAIRFNNGIVVVQGKLAGLKYQPGLNWGFVYHDPSDPIVQMAGGDKHLILRSEAGHIFTIGSNDDGQLGCSRRPGLYRQRQVGLGAIRRTIVLKKKMPNGRTKKEFAIFKKVSARGNTSSATAVDGTVYRCGGRHGPVFG